MQTYMQYCEKLMISFCPGNLGKDLRTTDKKKTLSEEVNLFRLLRFKLNSG